MQPNHITDDRLGQILLTTGDVTANDLSKALSIQENIGGKLGSILIRIGAVSEELLLDNLAQQLNLTVLGKQCMLPEIQKLHHFMTESAIQFDWFVDQSVIVWQDQEKIICCCRDPLLNSIRETIRYFYPQQSIHYVLIANQMLEAVLTQLQKEQSVELLVDSESDKELQELAEEAPIIELVNNIFSQAIDCDASDIHIEPGEEEFSVRFRMDGILYTRYTQPKQRYAAVASRIKLISQIDISEKRLPQDGRISTRVSGKEMDIRVSTLPGIKGESIVMRLLPKERDEIHLDKLGMLDSSLKKMQDLMHYSNGIVLVTGPTGSGKSTTLYSALSYSNDGNKKIITVEDPVEFQLSGITQIQVHSDIGYSFAKALRAILRQDPDTIMIGEIRDKETAEIAIQSALTGHLVLSTLHTNSALSAVTRLIDMGIEPFLISAPLKGVQAQRLIRKLCTHCATPTSVPPGIIEKLQQLEPQIVPNWLTAKGCEHCNHTGYHGRTGIYEILLISEKMQERIARNAPIAELTVLAEQEGFRNLYQDGLIKAAQGISSYEEIVRVTSSESTASTL